MSAILLRLGHYDERLLIALVNRRRPVLDLLMRGISRIADWPVAVAITLFLAGGFIPELQDAGIRAAWTLALSHLGVEVLKRVFTRERPKLPVGLTWLMDVPDRFSFPSGHATAGLSMALPLALAFGGVAGIAVLGVGILIGVSRCYLGVHYPGDVIAGWALTMSVFAAVVGFGI